MSAPLDSRRRFAATAEDYRRHRPSYPEALVDWIEAETGLPASCRVADIGCGTGISARLFASRGFDVIGVEPDPTMLLEAINAGVYCIEGEAAHTGLPDGSVDLVIAAQAFHWFDIPAALSEFSRICRPPGWCAVFWNLRAGGGIMDEYEELLLRASKEYRTTPRPEDTVEALRAAPEISRLSEWHCPTRQILDRAGFFGRVWSSSFVAHGVTDREAFDRELSALFDRHRRDDRIEFRYRTVAYLWQLPRPPASS